MKEIKANLDLHLAYLTKNCREPSSNAKTYMLSEWFKKLSLSNTLRKTLWVDSKTIIIITPLKQNL